MPSTVPVIRGLVYGGVDLQVLSGGFHRIYWEIISGGPDEPPEFRGEDRTIPYREGQLESPRRPHRKTILLAGFVSGVGADEAAQRSDTAAARQEMLTAFWPGDPAKVLACITEDDTEWTINAYPDPSGALIWEKSRIPTHQVGAVRLVAIDPPYWTAGV